MQSINPEATWRVLWRITDGPHLGTELYSWWSIPVLGRPAGPSGAYRLAVEAAIERRAPLDLHRRPPSYFFSGCVFRAAVLDVARNRNGVERPKATRY